MPHPLSDGFFEVIHRYYADPDKRGAVLECHAERMADALDAHHEALDGNEVVECEHCWQGKQIVGGEHPGAGTWKQECPFCLGTGKRLCKKDTTQPRASETA